MQKPTSEMVDPVKVMTHSVDMQTANKFTSTKKMKTWLRSHPNFKRQPDGLFVHIYDEEYTQYKEQVDEQHRRESLSVESPTEPIETPATGGDDVRGAADGDESSS